MSDNKKIIQLKELLIEMKVKGTGSFIQHLRLNLTEFKDTINLNDGYPYDKRIKGNEVEYLFLRQLKSVYLDCVNDELYVQSNFPEFIKRIEIGKRTIELNEKTKNQLSETVEIRQRLFNELVIALFGSDSINLFE